MLRSLTLPVLYQRSRYFPVHAIAIGSKQGRYFISARVIAPSDADETSAAYLWKTPEV
jgi:hypothetical protein